MSSPKWLTTTHAIRKRPFGLSATESIIPCGHILASRHVTAHELLESLRVLALERYGSNAREQLGSWGVTRCEDFGEIVFALIDKGAFGKRPEDRKEDFDNGYDFASVFPVATP